MSGFSAYSFLGRRSPVDCRQLIVHTQLLSPDEAVLATLKKGDVLEIAINAKTSVCVAKKGALVAGTIINIQLSRLMQCIKKGNDYEAIVRSISGGHCAVTIKWVE